MSNDDLVLPSRRQSDIQITALRKEMRETFSAHFKDDHFGISKQKVGELIAAGEERTKDYKVMKEELTQNKEALGYMLIAIQGEPDHDLLGKPNGKYVGGMENDIKELKDQGNGSGGFSVRTSSKFQTALITTAMIAIAQIAVAFIGRL